MAKLPEYKPPTKEQEEEVLRRLQMMTAPKSVEYLQGKVKELEANCDALAAEVVALREGLEKWEWFKTDFEGDAYCLTCGAYRPDGHTVGCRMAQALSAPSPRAEALLAVVEAAEKVFVVRRDYEDRLRISPYPAWYEVERCRIRDCNEAEIALDAALAAWRGR